MVIENLAKVVLVWEHVVLLGKESTGGVNQIDAGQVVLHRDLLRPNVLLHRDGVVSATLEREVIGDDHALSTMNIANASNDVARWNTLIKAS